MSVPLILTFVSTVAFAIEFLIFVDRYSSLCVRFFPYLLWAWGADTLSTGLNVMNALVPDLADLTTSSVAVAPEHLRRLFEPFYSGKPNGLGLDLTIAQRIAHAPGGRNGR